MCKRIILGIVFFGVCGGASAQTACSDLGYETRIGRVDDPNDEIINELSGKRIEAVAPDDGEEWNEDHCASGALYKVGAGTREDPRGFRGTWGPNSRNNVVTYDYEGSGSLSYIWSLWKDADGTQGLCWGNPSAGHAAIAEADAPGNIPAPDAADCGIP
jgi:hypothetical protein